MERIYGKLKLASNGPTHGQQTPNPSHSNMYSYRVSERYEKLGELFPVPSTTRFKCSNM